jgi:PAS domain S-box-containing protein
MIALHAVSLSGAIHPMQNAHKRFSTITAFSLLLIILVANLFLTTRRFDEQIRDQIGYANTRQILYELIQTESLLKDAEASQRGYLYTGDPKYLTPYSFSITRVDLHIDQLQRLTKGNSNEQKCIPELRRLADLKLSEMAQTIALYQAGEHDQARTLVLSGAGFQTMNDIRKVAGNIEQQESSVEAVRAAAYQKSVSLTIASIYLASLLAATGLVLLAWYIMREMNLREHHARQLRAREEWFRVTLTSVGEAVIATDAEGKVTFLNPLAERLTGSKLAEVHGKAIEEAFPIFNEYTHQPVENPVKKVIEVGKVIGLANHTVLRSRDGSLTPIEDSAAPIWDDSDKLIGVVLVFRDATDGRKAQEILRRTEKLAAAARLSATMAHEINNPLEAVGNLIYISKSAPGVPADVVHHLTLAEQELERVSHITRQTLGFFRESNDPESIQMTTVIDAVLALYSNKLRTKNITVHCDFGDCPAFKARTGELKQAMSNLIGNAADAVAENGTIWIKLACVERPQGNSVLVTIEDDGPGIPPEHLDRIFEPFFTTKKDVGTGLGLWVTKEIVDRHGGTILVSTPEENPSKGATFIVDLPIRETADQAS